MIIKILVWICFTILVIIIIGFLALVIWSYFFNRDIQHDVEELEDRD